MGPSGRLFVCNSGNTHTINEQTGAVEFTLGPTGKGGRIQIVDPRTGKCETLYDLVDGRPLNGPNDLVFDGAGGFWFTDFGRYGRHEIAHGGIYYARADGSLITTAVYPIAFANGVGLSPDGRTLYVALTFERLLLAFDITGPGNLSPQAPFMPGRVAAEFPARVGLDSLAVLANGDVCVGTVMKGRGIAQVKPNTGEIAYRPFPDLTTTNICFGGTDMCDAWVTLGSTGVVAKARWSTPGLRLAY
jgi:gluconolactonase